MHTHPEIQNWGIMPYLIQYGSFRISTYSFFVFLGLLAGSIIYYFDARKYKEISQNTFYIIIGALTGGILGAKLLEILINLDRFQGVNPFFVIFLSGKTIVGGLIGGTFGSVLTKRILRIRSKKGNLFAPAIALGVSIGRIGCFFNGCCYGKATQLFWAVDFGDGVKRHPTQIYESVFMIFMFLFFKLYYKNKEIRPGYLFKILMVNYFVFRFLIEFIREERAAFYGLSFFQLISVFALVYLFLGDIFFFFKSKFKYGR